MTGPMGDDQGLHRVKTLITGLLHAAQTAGVLTESWRNRNLHGITCRICWEDVVVLDRDALPESDALRDVDWQPHRRQGGTCSPAATT